MIVIGGPNAGKSSLLAAITRAKPEIAPYPYTTREPAPGMMTWEDVSVQIVDTPPITADHFPSYLNNLIRAADLVLLMIDMGSDDCIDDTQAVLQHFVDSKTRLGRQTML